MQAKEWGSTAGERGRGPRVVSSRHAVALVACVLGMFLAVPGCSSSPQEPAGNQEQWQDPADPPAPSPDQGTFETTTYDSADLRVPHRPSYELGYNDRGQLQVPPEPPADVPEVPLAPEGVEGFYLPTIDHVEQLPYGLMLYHGHDELKWLLIDDPTNGEQMDILGLGTAREREGGLEFVERTAEAGRVVGMEQFPAQRAHNRFTVRQAGESQGTTAFGDVMRELGAEVHWVRAAAVDGEANHVYTAPLTGRFNPTTRPSKDGSQRGDNTRRLAIWPDYEWRLRVVDEDDGSITIYGGTWRIEGEGRITFEQTLPPEYAVEPLVETFAYVFHPEHQVLWLTKLDAAGPGAETALLPRHPGETTVYQLDRPNQQPQ